MALLIKHIWDNKCTKQKLVTIPILHTEIKNREFVKVILLKIDENDKMQESDLSIKQQVFYNRGNGQKLIRIPSRCGMECGDFVRIKKLSTDEELIEN